MKQINLEKKIDLSLVCKLKKDLESKMASNLYFTTLLQLRKTNTIPLISQIF